MNTPLRDRFQQTAMKVHELGDIDRAITVGVGQQEPYCRHHDRDRSSCGRPTRRSDREQPAERCHPRTTPTTHPDASVWLRRQRLAEHRAQRARFLLARQQDVRIDIQGWLLQCRVDAQRIWVR